MCNYAEENKYDLLSKFESLKEFNDHFEQTMLLHKGKFTKSEHLALNKLRKFAADVLGVAWCRLQKAVSATHKDEMFGVSRSTFERMLRKAKKLNLVQVINQYKENNYQKHNVYVFNRVEELTPEKFEVIEIVSKSHTIDVAESMKIDAPRTLLLELPKIKDTNITKKTASQENVSKQDLKKKALIEKLPNALQGLSIYSNDSDMIYKLVSAMLAAKNKISNTIKFEEHEALFRKTIRSVYEYWQRKVKNGVEDYNVFGLLYKATYELCERIVDGTAYQVKENVSKAPTRKIENVPAWMQDKVKAFGNTRSEMVPEWMNNRHEEVKSVVVAMNENIDFEAERQKVLAKLFG